MERVIFVVEGSGERISCLLNPETLVFRRQAGLRTRTDVTGAVTGHAMSDDPVVATGGGRTEFDLDLLFDTAIDQELNPASETGPILADVRELTRPIWNLAENAQSADRYGGPAAVRFIWGRSWNILGAVTTVSEKLERFSPDGEPQRSWMRLRLRRLSEAPQSASVAPSVTPQYEAPSPRAQQSLQKSTAVDVPVDSDGMPQLRLDQLAANRYGDPSFWRVIAAFNGIDNPLELPAGTVLRLPPPDKALTE
jgi:Contractile injection system tube protein